MSLRLRLLIVATLAIVALATAIVTVSQLVADRDSLGTEEVTKSNGSALRALSAAATQMMPAGSRDEERAWLRTRARDALGPTNETRGGYCWSDGELVEEQSGHFGRGPRHHGPPPGDEGGPPDGPPPDDRGPPDGEVPGPPEDVRQALVEMCKAAVAATRDVSKHDQHTYVELVPLRPGLSAFAMRIRPGSTETHRWPPALGVITLATLLVIALNLHGLWTLRRGASQLSTVLDKLETDPRAEIQRPQTPELAEVALGVRALARRLADTQDHALDLERGNAHQKRLSSLGHLIAGIAHEVRNPLTGIKLLLEGIRRREGDAKTREDVDLALHEVARLDKLVTACLGVARDTQIENSDVDLGELVEQRIAASAGYASERGVTMTREGGVVRRADRDAVVRILDNLLRNAIDASPRAGAIRVVVSATAIDVIDAGSGVPAHNVAQLFEPFVTTKSEGTGLGLWMSLALAEARGGTVRYSRRDAATHFTLELGSA